MTEAEAKLHYGPMIAKWMVNDGRRLYKKYRVWPSPEACCRVLQEVFEGGLTRQQGNLVFEELFQILAAQNQCDNI